MGRKLIPRLAAAVLGAWCVGAHAAPSCLVAIDVGHSRQKPGATSARGATEWEFNIALAERLAGALAAAHVPYVLLNPHGETVSLTERTQAAQRAGASLFISIHHDSVQPQYLSAWEWQGKPARYSDRFSGYGLFVSSKNPAFDESARVASRIAGRLQAAGLRPTLHHAEPIAGENRPLLDEARGIYRFDDLVVLKTASMPAVLVESGVIVNRDEELRAKSPAYRANIAAAIAGAAATHCQSDATASLQQKE